MYVGLIFLISHKKSREKPVISFDENNLEVGVKNGEEVLLKGVHAFDQEDGNLDQKIVEDSISKFDEENNRIVTYTVFDSEANVAKAQRKIHYTNYTSIKFYLNDSFSCSTMNPATILSMIKAKSCVDGDVSCNVVAEFHSSQDTNVSMIKASVEDSISSKENLVLNYI